MRRCFLDYRFRIIDAISMANQRRPTIFVLIFFFCIPWCQCYYAICFTLGNYEIPFSGSLHLSTLCIFVYCIICLFSIDVY
uniref:G_PROTEIN_RECEP_F1_2 domain-containing protein n=1 Tax=Ascaris lumbricoides TaxID=6252 RepID=A0A0M3IUE3_ASCLU